METNIPAEIREDWNALLLRPGMSVLATKLTQEMSYCRSQLENPKLTDDYEKVCEVRGEMRGIRKITQYLKAEYDRAAKSDTPEKESK